MSDLSTEIPLLGRRLAVELEGYGRAFATLHSLGSNEMRALVIIMDSVRSGDPISPKQLSLQLDITTASVTALLDRLESVGHVRRDKHPTDRRSICLWPGEKAMQAGQEFFGGLNQALIARLSQYSKAELEVAARVMVSMIEVVQDEHARRSS